MQTPNLMGSAKKENPALMARLSNMLAFGDNFLKPWGQCYDNYIFHTLGRTHVDFQGNHCSQKATLLSYIYKPEPNMTK
jgi:hypothetical protein